MEELGSLPQHFSKHPSRAETLSLLFFLLQAEEHCSLLTFAEGERPPGQTPFLCNYLVEPICQNNFDPNLLRLETLPTVKITSSQRAQSTHTTMPGQAKSCVPGQSVGKAADRNRLFFHSDLITRPLWTHPC